jgi:hypothetical protein
MSNARIPCRPDESVLVTANGVDMFPCSATRAVTAPIPAGQYNVSIYLLDVNRMVESTVSLPNVVVQDGRITDLGNVVFVVPNAIGNVHFTWEVWVMGMQSTCSPSESIQFDFGNGNSFLTGCTPLSTVLGPVRTGSYSVNTHLLQGMLVETAGPTVQLSVAPYTTTEGGHIVFMH